MPEVRLVPHYVREPFDVLAGPETGEPGLPAPASVSSREPAMLSRRRHHAFAATALLLLASRPLAAERIGSQTFRSVPGLASDSVTALRADGRGSLWIGTTDGLSRYDGERFVAFGTEAGLPGPRILEVALAGGRLFVATGRGLAVLDAEHTGHRPFVPVPGPPGTVGAFEALAADRQDRLWAGGADGLAVFGPGGDARRVELGSGPGAYVQALACGPDGTVWAGTRGGLARLAPGRPPERVLVDPAGGSDDVGSLAVDEGGRLWVGHEQGLFVLLPAAAGREPAPGALVAAARPLVSPDGSIELPTAPGEVRWLHLDGRPIRQIRLDADGAWVGAVKALIHVGPRGLRTVDRDSGLPDDGISALETDGEGNVWVGAEAHGLVRLREDGVSAFGRADGLPEARVGALLVLPEGPLVAVGQTPWTIAVDRGGVFHAVTPRIPPGVSRASWGWGQVTLRDRAGEWWVPTGSGLLRYGRAMRPEALEGEQPVRRYTTADGLGGDDVFRLFEDSRGDLWISTFGDVLLTRRDGRTGRFERFPKGSFAPQAPTAFAEDGAGDLWIGLYGEGLVRRRGGRFESYGAAAGAPVSFVHALLVAHDGALWIGTGRDGLWRVADPAAATPTFERVVPRQPFQSDVVRALVEDGSGRIWLGTTRGVERFDPATGRVRTFGSPQGLPNGVVACAARDRDGALWFGTLDGLARIEPRQDPRERPPAAVLTSVSVDGVPRFSSLLGSRSLPPLLLPPSARRLSVEFAAPSLAPDAPALFSTRLSSGEGDFGPPSPDRRVLVAGLAPGRTRFEVRAVQADGRAGPAAGFDLVIAVPLWRRPWALVLAAAGLAALALLAHRVRVGRLVAVERVRTRIATDLHDDLGASLSRISLLAEVVRREAEGRPTAQRLAVDIGAAARRMGGALSDNIWSIDPRHDDLRSVADRVSTFAVDLFEGRGVAWRLELPPDLAGLVVPPEVRRHLLLALQEALNNVARHADARSVEVRFHRERGRLVVMVSDDGKGLPSPETPAAGSGRGLPGMRARAEALGGELEVLPGPASGTILRFDIPLPGSA